MAQNLKFKTVDEFLKNRKITDKLDKNISHTSLGDHEQQIFPGKYNIKPEEMNYWDLKLFISKLKNNGKEYNKWLVDLHFKTAFAFSNVLMILFGISLSIQKPRSNLLSGI